MEIFKTFTIEAAHRLPNLPSKHKCSRLHGHSFVIEIHIQGDVNENQGWVMDFADISQVFKPIYDRLDHCYLNDIEGLENPTSENLAKWIWDEIILELQLLYSIVVIETCNSGCVYRGS